MATYSQNLTLTVPNGGTDEISIKVEELSYNANTNIATVRITLGFYVGIRWDDSNGGDVYADIYAVGPDSSGSGADLSCRWHIGKTNGVWDRYTWHYATFDKTMYCTYDGKAQCTVQRWGWSRNTTNVYVPKDGEIYNGWAITTLNTHDRVSTLTVSSTSVAIDGTSALNMTVNRKSTLMTDHDLLISYPTAQGQYSQTIQLRNSTTTASYIVDTGLLNYLPANGKSITGQIVLRTYYLPKWYEGSTLYKDSAAVTFTATARDSDIAPTLTLNAIDWTNDGNVTSGLVGNLDNYIFNISKCVLSGTAQTKYNATASSFGLFTNDDKPIGIANTGTAPNYEFYLNQIAQSTNFSSANTLKVKITDSRGLTGSINVPLSSFIPYIKKSLNETYDVTRVNPTSPVVEINSVTGKWWNGNFLGQTPNNLTISWDYKEASSAGDYTTGGTIDTLNYSSGTPSSTYTTYDNATQTFTISNYAFTKSGSSNLFDYQKAYLIRLTVTDVVTGQIANPLYITISAGVANFTIHKDTILINGKTIWDILYPVGSLYLSADYNFDPNTVFTGHTWVRVNGGYYLYAGTSTGQSGTNTGEGALSHVLTAAESGLPAHSHTGTANWVSLAGNAYNLMWDDGRDGGMARDGIVSIGGWTRNRSWSGTNGDASRSLGVNASHSHGLTIDNNTAASATSGHTHPIATYKVAVWRRTA